MNRTFIFSLIPALFAASSSVLADTASTEITVTGEVARSCTISGPATMDFGAMLANEDKTLTNQISVTCTNLAPYTITPHDTATISVTGTLNGSAMNETRAMSGASSIDVGMGTVSLYADSSGTVAWSDSAPISDTGTGAAKNHPIAMKFVHDGSDHGSFSFTLRPTVSF